MKVNTILANFIYVFHLLIIMFVVFIPFTQIPAYLILHVVFSICLISHWYNNNNACSLSMLESKLRGIDYTNGFSHQFIAPIYDISTTEWSKICYVIVITLSLVSIYYLITSPRWETMRECINKTKKDIERQENLTFNDKMSLYINCLEPLFI